MGKLLYDIFITEITPCPVPASTIEEMLAHFTESVRVSELLELLQAARPA